MFRPLEGTRAQDVAALVDKISVTKLKTQKKNLLLVSVYSFYIFYIEYIFLNTVNITGGFSDEGDEVITLFLETSVSCLQS